MTYHTREGFTIQEGDSRRVYFDYEGEFGGDRALGPGTLWITTVSPSRITGVFAADIQAYNPIFPAAQRIRGAFSAVIDTTRQSGRP